MSTTRFIEKENYYECVTNITNVVFIIDKEDYELVSKYSWQSMPLGKNGKKRIVSHKWNKQLKKYQNVYLGRLIMNCPEKKVVDHINGDDLDNRKINLRVCTQAENKRNTLTKNNKYRCNGVSKHGNGYISYIWLNGKQQYLGYNKDIEKAKELRIKTEKEYWGDFAPYKRYK